MIRVDYISLVPMPSKHHFDMSFEAVTIGTTHQCYICSEICTCAEMSKPLWFTALPYTTAQ